MENAKNGGNTPFQKEVVERYVKMEKTLAEMFKDVQNGSLIPYKSGAIIADCLNFVSSLANFSSALATQQLLKAQGKLPESQISEGQDEAFETEDFSDILNDKELLGHLASGNLGAIAKMDDAELLDKVWKFFRYSMSNDFLSKQELLQMSKHLAGFSVALLKDRIVKS